jgi:hypothetical protein
MLTLKLTQVIRAAGIAAFVALAVPSESLRADTVLLSENFDSIAVNAQPAGWTTDASGPSETSSVQASATAPSQPNAYMVNMADNTASFTTTAQFTPFNMDTSIPYYRWSADINVVALTGNFSDGYIIRAATSLVSNLAAGEYRVLSTPTDASKWGFYNGPTSGSFDFNTWHHVLIEIIPSSDTAGSFSLYVDNNLLNSGFYAGQSTNQIQNIKAMQLVTQSNNSSNSQMLLDNVLISIPEPASVCLLGASGIVLLSRRR